MLHSLPEMREIFVPVNACGQILYHCWHSIMLMYKVSSARFLIDRFLIFRGPDCSYQSLGNDEMFLISGNDNGNYLNPLICSLSCNFPQKCPPCFLVKHRSLSIPNLYMRTSL